MVDTTFLELKKSTINKFKKGKSALKNLTISYSIQNLMLFIINKKTEVHN